MGSAMNFGMSMRRRAGATLATSALLTVATIVPAAAEIDRHEDPAGDVVRIDSGHRDAPWNRRADIIRFVTDHDGSRLRLALEHRNIRLHVSTSLLIKTPDAKYHAFVFWRRGQATSVDFTRFSGGPEICPHTVAARVNRETDKVTFSVPRRCVDRPEWVKTGAVSFAFRDPDKHVTYFADDARTGDGYLDGDFPLLGEKIHHN